MENVEFWNLIPGNSHFGRKSIAILRLRVLIYFVISKYLCIQPVSVNCKPLCAMYLILRIYSPCEICETKYLAKLSGFTAQYEDKLV